MGFVLVLFVDVIVGMAVGCVVVVLVIGSDTISAFAFAFAFCKDSFVMKYFVLYFLLSMAL